jgi:hypothetical protein
VTGDLVTLDSLLVGAENVGEWREDRCGGINVDVVESCRCFPVIVCSADVGGDVLICNGDLVPLALFAPLIILDPNPTLPYPYAPFSIPAVPSLSDNDPAGGLIGAASKLLVSLADVESLHVDVFVDIAGRGVGEEGPREFDDFLKGRLNGMLR